MHAFLRRQSLLAFLFAALVAASSEGAVMFSTGLPNGVSGNDATFWQQAEPFALATPANLTGAGIYLAGFGDLANWDGTLEYFIYSDLGGSPDLPLASGFGTSISLVGGFAWDFGGDSVRASFQFASPFAASAFTPYWFAIHLASDYANTDNIFWVTAAPTFGAGQELVGGVGAWVSNDQSHAFFLTDSSSQSTSVPEPKSLALWGFGALIATALVGRRWFIAPR